MNEFEFLSVLISIIIGLGLTHLLSGIGKMFYFRQQSRLDLVHLGWTVSTFLLLVVNWWVALLWRDYSPWTFAVFMTVVVWTITMYLMVLALFPPQEREAIDYHALMADNRIWLLTAFIINMGFDVIVNVLRENGQLTFIYIVYVIVYIGLSIIGLFVRQRGYQLFLSWSVAITLAIWCFVYRDTLWLETAV